MERKLNVAAFGAHPDDIEIYMMGTLAKYREQGHNVYMVVATDGQRGSWNPCEETAQIRRGEAQASAAYIGVEPVFIGLEDGKLIYDRETCEKVNEVYTKIAPDVVITHDPEDYHTDHKALSRMLTDLSCVPVFYADTSMGVNFCPEFYVDITQFVELKRKALQEHKSQDVQFWTEKMEILNRFRGAQCGKIDIKYAEAFRMYRRCGLVRGYELLPL